MFIDPLCPECWALEPIMKKLTLNMDNILESNMLLVDVWLRLNMGKKQNFENIAELWDKTASRFGMSCDGSLMVRKSNFFTIFSIHCH